MYIKIIIFSSIYICTTVLHLY